MTETRYAISAFNTAFESENRIHDDGVAQKFGFEGGLVPGVDDYAYMTRAALLLLGPDFLTRGHMTCRFDRQLKQLPLLPNSARPSELPEIEADL